MAIGWISMPRMHSNTKNFALASEIDSVFGLRRVTSALHHLWVARSYHDFGLTGRYSADVLPRLRDNWLNRSAGT